MENVHGAGEPRSLDIRSVQLTSAQQAALLSRARLAISSFLATGQVKRDPPSDPLLKQHAGAFVTLWRRVGDDPSPPFQLRGCIGHIEADRPLFQVVSDMAVQAATRDPRFPQLKAETLPEINIEISILSSLQRIEAISEIIIGQDGLVIVQGHSRGLLLPEVPLRYGWNQEEFVQNLCNKAGLELDAWRRGAKLYRFVTDSFSEQDHR